jgi:hypothetical protein
MFTVFWAEQHAAVAIVAAVCIFGAVGLKIRYSNSGLIRQKPRR